MVAGKTHLDSVHARFYLLHQSVGDRGIEPGRWLTGELALANAVVDGHIPLDSVHTHFAYSNLRWSLSDLQLVQGRTSLSLSGEVDEVTRNFHCLLSGMLDAENLPPFLTDTNAARGFSLLSFRDPVALALDATGNLRDFKTLSVTGRVEATDFAIRDQWIDSLWTALAYTNLTAEFFHPQLVRANGVERFEAEKVTLDISGQRLFIHRGLGNISPMAVGGPSDQNGQANGALRISLRSKRHGGWLRSAKSCWRKSGD